ncbi:putative Outer envelope pore protein 24B, chloroplastic [Cocos nucifera]|nr:putative Outer envelope pore protein 24B, chloroplastic [Cocos nucifera]
MKATLKGKYENIKSSATASLSVDVYAGDVKLKATVANLAAAYALSFSVEKPGSFSISYSPEKDVKFQFMNSMKVLGRAVDLTYTDARGQNRTAVDGAVAFDARNRVAVSHALGTKEWKVRHTYTHGALRRTVTETSYDFKSHAWDFAVTRRSQQGDAVKATYGSSTRAIGLEWARNSPITGTFKVGHYLAIFHSKMTMANVDSTDAYSKAERFMAKAKEAEVETEHLREEMKKLRDDLVATEEARKLAESSKSAIEELKHDVKVPKQITEAAFQEIESTCSKAEEEWKGIETKLLEANNKIIEAGQAAIKAYQTSPEFSNEKIKFSTEAHTSLGRT